MTERCANPEACGNIKRSPEGFDGEQLNCAVCGYYRFIEGRYFKWVDRSRAANGEVKREDSK